MPSHLRERAVREGIARPGRERPVFMIRTKNSQPARTMADTGGRERGPVVLVPRPAGARAVAERREYAGLGQQAAGAQAGPLALLGTGRARSPLILQ
jgi:hypothetical protein